MSGTFRKGHNTTRSARGQKTLDTIKALAQTKGPTQKLAFATLNKPRSLARYHDPELNRIKNLRQRSRHLAAHLGFYDEPTCYLCGRTLDTTECHLEHIIALSQGGTDHHENLAIACAPCNHTKGARYVAFMVASRKPIYLDPL